MNTSPTVTDAATGTDHSRPRPSPVGHGGPADLIRHGVDGLLAKCGDVTELAERWRELTDGNLRARLGDSGRTRVAEEFRWADKLELVRATMLRIRANPARKGRGWR